MRSHESVRGRTFEWWIEVMNSRHEIYAHGSPLWVARELTASSATLGQRIIGRAPLPSGAHSGLSTPALLWQAISHYCGPDAPRFTGVTCTGLIHPSMQALLEAVDESDGLPLLSGFGARTGIDELAARRLRDTGAVAGVAFVQALESIR